MRSVRSLAVVVVTTVLMLSVLASFASASSQKPFHLMKTCASDVLCIVVSSSFKAIPAGTRITYVNVPGGIAYPSIVVRNGSTTGVCNWNQPPGPVLAKCTFRTGTGRLSQFHLAVDVTFNGTYWFWDGTYWFGGRDHGGHDGNNNENDGD
jgi:hypothetical protein